MIRLSFGVPRACVVALTVAIFTLLAVQARAEPLTLTIVHVNDHDRMSAADGRGGVAKVAAVVNEIRRDRAHVLVTHGGDTISPSLLAGFDQGAHMIDLWNRIGIDALVLGNHEFDFGPDIARARIAEATFPILGNNAIEPDGTLVDGVTESLLLEFGPYRVGLFGLTTRSTATKSSPGDVTFRAPEEVAAEQAAALREAGANLVLALAHTDRAEDEALERQGLVDLVLSGDDHDLRIHYDGRTGLVESGSQGNFVTVIDIAMTMEESRGGPRFTWAPAFQVIDTATVDADPALAGAVEAYEAQLSDKLDIEIGTTETELDSRRASIRSMETGMGNLIVDAMREAVGADVAITNGGGIRADKVYAPGTVLTRRDIQSELPFGNRTVLLEVTGADIRAALENAVSEVENGAGRFAHVSGMTYGFDASRPAGARIVDVTVAGQPLEAGRTYTLATNDFMAKGGDGYAVFVDAKRIIDENAGAFMASQVMAHIEALGQVAPTVEGRITRLD